MLNLVAALNACGTPDPAKLAEIIAAIIVWVQRESTYWGREPWAMNCRQAPAHVEWRPTGKCGVEAMGRLEGKVAIITGGARGQGALEAELFAKEGAKVVICDILDQEGKDVEAKVLATDGDAVYSHLDVTRDDDWQEAVDLAESRYGKLDVLVNNAGIARGASIEETSEELWDEVLAVNTKGVFLGTRRAIPAMRRAGGGSIINVSSIAGILGRKLAPAVYSASKGAVRVFTKSTAIQHAHERIRCNSIHPGPIDTPMLAGITANPAMLRERTDEVPLGRLGSSEDVAFGVLYLASDESSWITGIELIIDGGITAM